MTDRDLELSKNAVIVGTANLQHIIARLIAGERERCASIADNLANTSVEVGMHINEMKDPHIAGMAILIARRIRNPE